MPYKEEDEGYLAAETGRRLSENPHPRGTIRHDDWRRGWYAKSNEGRRKETRAIRPLKPDIRCPKTRINPAQSGINDGGGTGT